MVDKEKECYNEVKSKKIMHGKGGPSGALYGMGFIGALVYFIQHADTFWIGVLGIFKAIVWPAIMVYKLLQFLKL